MHILKKEFMDCVSVLKLKYVKTPQHFEETVKVN